MLCHGGLWRRVLELIAYHYFVFIICSFLVAIVIKRSFAYKQVQMSTNRNCPLYEGKGDISVEAYLKGACDSFVACSTFIRAELER